MFDEHNLTPSAARTFLRRMRLGERRVYLAVAQRGVRPHEPGASKDQAKVPDGGYYVPVRGAVPVPRSVALEYLAEAYDDPAVLVRVAVGDTCVVVGRA